MNESEADNWAYDRYVTLEAVVGSTAYGLATPESDIDTLGCYLTDPKNFWGLTPGIQDSIVNDNPDSTFHEMGKFFTLLIKCNPTVTELLWMDDYTLMTPLGEYLIARRQDFLSPKIVRDAYLGYATQQFRKLQERGDGTFSSAVKNRTAKHARHLLRLLRQGHELYSTGNLTVKVESPLSIKKFGDDVAAGDIEQARQTISLYEQLFDETTPAFGDADRDSIEALLVSIRKKCYDVGTDWAMYAEWGN